MDLQFARMVIAWEATLETENSRSAVQMCCISVIAIMPHEAEVLFQALGVLDRASKSKARLKHCVTLRWRATVIALYLPLDLLET